MTDLRDRIGEFEAAARRLLAAQPRPRLVLVHARPARCHPARALLARGLCRKCYQLRWARGEFVDTRPRRRPEFVADYEMLRSEGYTRRQIAERLGYTRRGLDQAYYRAVKAGELTRDRRLA